jgi:4-oxalocrotonate tautomerase
MPLVRIDLQEGKTTEYRAQVGEIVYRAMLKELNIPEDDRFQIITEHPRAELSYDRDYLGIHRSDDCIFIQITLSVGRAVQVKQRFYQSLAEALHKELKIRMEDVFINLVEVNKEDWSFGNGVAQYVPKPQ